MAASFVVSVRRVHPSIRPPKPTAREGDDVESGEQWGQTVATPGAVEWLQQATVDAALLLSRHENGDCG